MWSRGQIANGIDSFVAELPVDVDYNIAVIQGHSSLSSYTGKVYGYGSNPAVLKSSELSVSDIRSYLKTNMTKVKTDYPRRWWRRKPLFINKSHHYRA